MGKNVIYNGQVLTLTRFWADQRPGLWIHDPRQVHMSKMEFVGGYPNEYCIFIEKLSAEERAKITLMDGSPIDIEKEIEALG